MIYLIKSYLNKIETLFRDFKKLVKFMEIIKTDNYEDIKFLNDNYVKEILILLKEKSYESILNLSRELEKKEIFLSENKLRRILQILSSYKIIKLTKLRNGTLIERLKDVFSLQFKFNKITFGEIDNLLLSESIKGYANFPINPEKFSKEVVLKLNSYNQIVPLKTTVMAKELCKVFNECIKYNKQKRFSESTETGEFRSSVSNDAYKTFVCSPRTGSAKSLSLKVYTSMLKTESSLIILKDVDDVNQFCKDINEWSGNPDYARCHYSINQDNLKSKFHVTRTQLAEFRCIVITHSLFKQLKHQKRYELINLFENNKRNLIVIDERISFFKHHKITKDEIKNIDVFLSLEIGFFKRNSLNFAQSEVDDIVNKLNLLSQFVYLFNYLFETMLENDIKLHNYEFIWAQDWDSLRNNKNYNLELFNIYIDNYLFVSSQFSSAFLAHNSLKKIINEQRRKLKTQMEAMFYIIKNASVVEKTGKRITIHSIDEYHNDFSSYVVLDATAHINAYYNLSSKSIFKNLSHIRITNPKRYDNLTFHIARGYAQGRSSIYKDSTKDLLHEVNRYLKIANEIINENDKLLILGHKDFVKYLEKNSKDKRIFFTHWGRHIGKNDWSACNKVLVIGWNYIPKIEHYLTLSAANNGFDNAYDDSVLKHKKLISTMTVHQIADDLIQGISRGALRNVIDKNGNCPICEIYILARWKDEQTDKVLDIVTNEFNNSRKNLWMPLDIGSKKKKTKPQIKIEKIINYVAKKLETSEFVKVLDVKKELDISNSTFHRITNEEFEKLCLNKNIIYTYLDKKSKGFKNLN